ncbi:hypothetical protein PENTCL1PPCAC_1964, partial [Pristionchus entomophagus]
LLHLSHHPGLFISLHTHASNGGDHLLELTESEEMGQILSIARRENMSPMIGEKQEGALSYSRLVEVLHKTSHDFIGQNERVTGVSDVLQKAPLLPHGTGVDDGSQEPWPCQKSIQFVVPSIHRSVEEIDRRSGNVSIAGGHGSDDVGEEIRLVHDRCGLLTVAVLREDAQTGLGNLAVSFEPIHRSRNSSDELRTDRNISIFSSCGNTDNHPERVPIRLQRLFRIDYALSDGQIGASHLVPTPGAAIREESSAPNAYVTQLYVGIVILHGIYEAIESSLFENQVRHGAALGAQKVTENIASVDLCVQRLAPIFQDAHETIDQFPIEVLWRFRVNREERCEVMESRGLIRYCSGLFE